MAVKTWASGEVLTASDLNTYAGNPGLVYVGSASFSAITNATPVDLTSILTSTYESYRVVVRWSQASAAGNFYMRFLSGASTPETGAVYNYFLGGGWVTGVPAYNFAGYASTPPAAPDTLFNFTTVGSGYKAGATVDLIGPNLAQETMVNAQVGITYTGSLYNVSLFSNGSISTSTQYTGLRFYPSAGNTTGKVIVYGYRQA